MSEKNWLSHVEWAVMFVTLISGFYAMDARIDATNSRLDSCMQSMNSRFDQFMVAWHEESKDFHGRLCAIEERNKNK